MVKSEQILVLISHVKFLNLNRKWCFSQFWLFKDVLHTIIQNSNTQPLPKLIYFFHLKALQSEVIGNVVTEIWPFLGVFFLQIQQLFSQTSFKFRPMVWYIFGKFRIIVIVAHNDSIVEGTSLIFVVIIQHIWLYISRILNGGNQTMASWHITAAG